jgi:hypothetical protein
MRESAPLKLWYPLNSGVAGKLDVGGLEVNELMVEGDEE